MEKRRTMFSRCMALLMILALSIALLPAADTQAKTTKAAVSMKAKAVTKYTISLANAEKDTVYYNGNSDIPYFELDSRRKEMENTLKESNPSGFSISSKVKGTTVTWTRKSAKYGSTKVVFDYKKNTITFEDLNDFFRQEGLSLVGAENGMGSLIALYQADEESNYNRHGKKNIVINLNKYGIKLLKDKKKFYIPVQTYSDLFISRIGAFQAFNGDYLFITNDGTLGEMKELYNSAKKRTFSKAYAAFNYGELCLLYDTQYGLKDSHDIKSFDEFFTDTGLAKLIKQQDSLGTDYALCLAVNLYFDDMHCAFTCPSWNTDFEEFRTLVNALPQGAYRTRAQGVKAELFGYRAEKMTEVLPYEEVGDTAYITFDGFAFDPTADHMKLPTDDDLMTLGGDTIRLVQYAVNKINNNSKIKNVVVDLSLNGGGAIITADYLLAAFLGTSSMAIKDMFTGAQSMVNYKADVNLDGAFDEKDTLAGKGLNLYCLTSGYSYSCANMVPAMFKDSGKVTLIGRTTGGGSCSVSYGSTASGGIVSISSPTRFSFTKNGGFYDVDRGAEPDVVIKDMSKLYDRKYLNTVLADIK